MDRTITAHRRYCLNNGNAMHIWCIVMPPTMHHIVDRFQDDTSMQAACRGGGQGCTCSLPQSNWMRRRSGKKSCWRTMAVRSGAERAKTSACRAAARVAASATVLGSGRLHHTSGGGARACMCTCGYQQLFSNPARFPSSQKTHTLAVRPRTPSLWRRRPRLYERKI